MKIGIIAGNRLLPILLARRIKEKNPGCELIALCFKGETSSAIRRFADKTYWIEPGHLSALKRVLKEEDIKQCLMAGQINPLRIFKRKNWDREMTSLADSVKDFRPHTIFQKIIGFMEEQGVKFLDSTLYLKQDLAESGSMNGLNPQKAVLADIDFGLKVISEFVELDVGQAIVVKAGAVTALESFEGTDSTIRRGCRLAGRGCIVFKFSKANQDLRFDVPVVGLSTLRLLKKAKARALVLEKGKVIILEKGKFLSLAKKWGIVVYGGEKTGGTKMKEKEIGVISHYFGNISVGIIELKAPLKVGDKIHIKGAHDDYAQVIESMQIEHVNVEKAKKGDSIGIKVTEKVHVNDKVYLVTE